MGRSSIVTRQPPASWVTVTDLPDPSAEDDADDWPLPLVLDDTDTWDEADDGPLALLDALTVSPGSRTLVTMT